MPGGGALRRTRHAYTRHLSVHQQTALISWLAFLGGFGGVRALTYAIRDRVRPFTDVRIGELHIHHYLWGICLLAGVGAAALYGDQRPGPHPLLATAYGTGGALIVDEFALLLDLQDVYWARQGRWSVDLGVAIAGAAGSYFAAVPFWRRLLHTAEPGGGHSPTQPGVAPRASLPARFRERPR